MKRVLAKYRTLTSDDPNVDFNLHDFGFRGVSSVESAGIGGAAHLVSFRGTDTMEALMVARKFYGEPMAGFSIPAAEHSTITSWGREGELDAYLNMLQSYPTDLVAVVSDSYDIYNAVGNLWGDKLRAEVMGRNGVLVIRPDSGHPPQVVRKVLELLWEKFGGTVNSKGFKVLDPHVRVIQGDGITFSSLPIILHEACLAAGFSSENVAFGSGGGLLQQLNRDTQRCAFKCSYIEGQTHAMGDTHHWHRDVYKQPVTDAGKKSKRGRFSDEEWGLREVFRDGKLLIDETFDTIRQRAELV